jgi:pyrimidine operon attenuation protein/uracil phosphoribosyltransferase
MDRVILDARGVERCLRRMASELVDSCARDVPLALVGIRTGGLPLAVRLADLIEAMGEARPRVGAVDITLYRDDLVTGLERPTLGETELPFDLDGTGIFLVDDVLFTGRTVRAALDAVHDFGRPRFLRLAVLIDRGHRELPIQPDVVGRRVATEFQDRVVVDARATPSPDDRVTVGARRP